jgi:hypothetical protein
VRFSSRSRLIEPIGYRIHVIVEQVGVESSIVIKMPQGF